jgi:hypothetical protein
MAVAAAEDAEGVRPSAGSARFSAVRGSEGQRRVGFGLILRVLFPRFGGPAVAGTGVAFLVGLIAGASSGAYEKAFYEATAQIIPVLLLVLAVEARFFRIDLMSFRELRESFEAELRESLGEDPSRSDMVRAGLELQGGRTIAYIQQRVLLVLALGALIGGEVISVLILGQPDLESSGLQGVVLGATFAGLAAVVVTALTGEMSAGERA